MGQRAEALASIEEAVQHYSELAGKNREAFLPDLAMSLNNRANLQSEMGQRAEALASIEEAVQIRRELAGKNREAFLPDLARSLAVRGNILFQAGNTQAATEQLAEAVRLSTPFAQELPTAYFPLALTIARLYRDAALAAGLEPDTEYTWPLDVVDRMQKQTAASE
jgi:tetratricopeptide (TPR) repeat protein